MLVKSTVPLNLDTVFRIAHDLRKHGGVIGFTHGAFDLFHYGHLDFLREAAKKCDFLVVGVDSNKNIAKYKSYSRPIIDEKRRLEIVNSIDCVGATILNQESFDKWVDLASELRAKVLLYGPAFGGMERIVKEAEKTKGKLVKVGHDYERTSKIIQKIIKTQKLNYPV
jgi:glycerol-3-phosphate cytidylyltransferase